MDNPILGAAIPSIVMHGGVILVAGVLPVMAFYILDGVVALFRGRGIVAFLIAIGMVAAIAVAGALAWRWGLDQFAGTSVFATARAAAELNAGFFVGWAIALGAVGFLFRMAKLATARKKRA